MNPSGVATCFSSSVSFTLPFQLDSNRIYSRVGGVGGRFWENGRRTSILWSLHREFHARHFDIRFYILSTMRSWLICLNYRTSLILLPGIFFSMESMGLVSFLKFGTKNRGFSKGKVAKKRWFEGRSRTSFSYGVARRHFRKKLKPDLKSAAFKE